MRTDRDWTAASVIAITAVAALLRFSTLGVQSYWLDEILTVNLVGSSFGEMLSGIRETEANPPLYYVFAWTWAQPFGTGEVGLRSFSALIGTATIPVIYVALAELVSRRVGLVAAALAAVNPFLVWYSQEARPYALLAFLGALSVLFFIRAVRSPSGRAFAWWAVPSALALATHYFAVFLVGAEALVLLVANRRRVAAAIASAALLVVGGALIPLALDQGAEGTDWIAQIPLVDRLRSVPEGFMFNSIVSSGPFLIATKWLSAALVALGLVMFVARARDRERAGGLLLLAIGLIALAASLAGIVLGIDVFYNRYMIALWLPVMGVVAIGFGARGASPIGPAAATILCAVGLALVVVIATDRQHQRAPWREVAELVARSGGPRALVLDPEHRRLPLTYYVSDIEALSRSGARVEGIDVVHLAPSADSADRPGGLTPPEEFRIAEIRELQRFTLVRLESAGPKHVGLPTLHSLSAQLFGDTTGEESSSFLVTR